MAEKHAQWAIVGGNSLTLGDKVTAVRTTLDLNEVFPGFDSLPEYERVLLVYGVKQRTQDHNSTIKGQPKVTAMIPDLTVEVLQALTFKGEGKRSGITSLERTQKDLAEGMEKNLKEKEQEMLRTLMVKAGMGKYLKVKDPTEPKELLRDKVKVEAHKVMEGLQK